MNLNRTVIIAVVVLLLVPTSLAFSQILRAKSSITVFDSKGKKVGKVLTLHSGIVPIVAFAVNKRIVALWVFSNRLAGNRDQVYFESADCTGTPFIQTLSESFFPEAMPSLLAAISNSTDTLYVVGDNPTPQNISVSSYFDFASGDSCEEAGGFPLEVFPAEKLQILTTFSPPFTVR